MTEGRRRGERAEAADALALAADMRPEPAMHRGARHRLVAALAGVVLRDIGDEARRQQPHIAESALPQQHLVERRHAARRRIAAAARHAGRLEFGRVVARLGGVGIGAARLLALRHADKDVAGEAERGQDLVADHLAVIPPGHRLDDHRLGQMRGARVVLQPRSRRPVEREVADLGAHPRVVGPGRLGHVAAWKSALMRHDLMQGDLALAALRELRQVIGDPVHEGKLAFLDQRPDRRAGQHLGLAEQQEQIVLLRRRVPRLGLRVAISPEQRQLPVPGQRDLRARVTAFLDMLPDQPVEMLQRGRGKAEARRVGGWQRVVVEHGCLLPGVQSQDAT